VTNTPKIELSKRIREARIAAGLTRRAAAMTAHVSERTWGRWESGTTTPTLARGGDIARALGVPLGALFVLDGERVVAEVRLTADAVVRVRQLGVPEAERLAAEAEGQLAPLILQRCRIPPPAGPDRRGQRRRTRAEVLAGIAEAKRTREAAAMARRRGGLEGQLMAESGRLPGWSA
jgi:transcriptional regulator with XRE-family HTH domain